MQEGMIELLLAKNGWRQHVKLIPKLIIFLQNPLLLLHLHNKHFWQNFLSKQKQVNWHYGTLLQIRSRRRKKTHWSQYVLSRIKKGIIELMSFVIVIFSNPKKSEGLRKPFQPMCRSVRAWSGLEGFLVVFLLGIAWTSFSSHL